MDNQTLSGQCKIIRDNIIFIFKEIFTPLLDLMQKIIDKSEGGKDV